jgi:hypothetical protein
MPEAIDPLEGARLLRINRVDPRLRENSRGDNVIAVPACTISHRGLRRSYCSSDKLMTRRKDEGLHSGSTDASTWRPFLNIEEPADEPPRQPRFGCLAREIRHLPTQGAGLISSRSAAAIVNTWKRAGASGGQAVVKSWGGGAALSVVARIGARAASLTLGPQGGAARV